MRFFDYKFLILLGLTLVVYFIYREVEYLRSKVDKIEAELNLNQKKISLNDNSILEFKDHKPNTNINTSEINNNASKPILQLPTNPNSNTNSNSNSNTNTNIILEEKSPSMGKENNELVQVKKSHSPPKVICLDLVSQSNQSPSSNLLGPIGIKFPINIRPESSNSKEAGIKINKIMNKITDILQEKSEDVDADDDSDSDDEDTTTDLSTESSKHLAIYSNDNEQFDSTQNSLIESVEANKNNLHFNYNMDIPNLKATMDDIINSLSSDKDTNDKDTNKKSKREEDKNNTSNNLIDLESLQIARQQEIEDIIIEKEKQLTEMSQKSESDKSKSTSEKSKIIPDKPLSPLSQIQISSKKSDTYTEIELNDKKLSDIKEIASKLGITFSKKVNGQQKQKSKQELINEILQK